MKKRFTVMLNEDTIMLLKKLAAKTSPIGHREALERVLYSYAKDELDYLEVFNNGNK